MDMQEIENLDGVTSPELVPQAAQGVADPAQIIETALSAQETNPGAIFEETVLDALRVLRDENPAEFLRYRARAKEAHKDTRLSELDRLMSQDGKGEASVLSNLIALAKKCCRLDHNADRKGVAVIERGGHREVWIVGGTGFKNWLRAEYFLTYEAGVAESTLTSAINTIRAICVHRGEQVEVHARCAKSSDSYYIDLCDAHWRAIKIGPSGSSHPLLAARVAAASCRCV